MTPHELLTALEATLPGKAAALKLALAAWLADGHVLIEDLPGTGKTTLARTLANAFGFRWQRIQGTPDLLPADITGSLIWDRQQQVLRFVPGPIFAEVVLFDEINRAHPKAQSALLEAMQERQVSIEGTSHALPQPFLVIATQNPMSQIGVHPLPEGQLDRFMVRLHLGWPTREAERAIVRAALTGAANASAPSSTPSTPPFPRASSPASALTPFQSAPEHAGGTTANTHTAAGSGIASASLFFTWQHQVQRVTVRDEVLDYLLALVAATRQDPAILLGLSPRAAVQLAQLARSWAFLAGRSYVLPDDVQAVFPHAASHRLLWRDPTQASAAIAALVARVPCPG